MNASLPRVNAVLFDLDGVILDSKATILASLRHAVQQHEIPNVSDADLLHCVGPPLAEVARTLATRHPQPSDQLAFKIADAYRAHYQQVCFTETPVFAEMTETLRQFAKRFPLAVASSKPTDFSIPILRNLKLDKFFQSICGPTLDLATPEPKTQTAARALREISNPPPTRAAIVGDREHDITAGKNNGLITVAVTWGFGEREELEDAQPDCIVHSPRELRSLFEL